MRKSTTVLAGAALAAISILASPGAANEAEAFSFIPFPFFTPIADCGTVGTVPNFYGEEDCLAWFPDNSPGAYLVGGLDAFEVGDHIWVEGDICNTCLTTCAAGAIFNATIDVCE